MSPIQDKNSQPEGDNGSPSDLRSENPLIRAVSTAVTELQTARGYIERDLKEGRDDIKLIREALARLETKVGDLPSKTWIFTAAGALVGAAGVLIAAVYKLATGH